MNEKIVLKDGTEIPILPMAELAGNRFTFTAEAENYGGLRGKLTPAACNLITVYTAGGEACQELTGYEIFRGARIEEVTDGDGSITVQVKITLEQIDLVQRALDNVQEQADENTLAIAEILYGGTTE